MNKQIIFANYRNQQPIATNNIKYLFPNDPIINNSNIYFAIDNINNNIVKNWENNKLFQSNQLFNNRYIFTQINEF